MEQHPDYKYIKFLCKGDDEGIREIYRLHSNQVKHWVLNNQGSVADAKDLFQEALIAIYERYCGADFRLTCPFGALLIRICKYTWYDRIKHNRREGEIKIVEQERYDQEADDEDVLLAAEETSAEHQRQMLLDKAFSQLSERCQQLLQLLGKGTATEIIAAKLEMTNPNAVYQGKRKCGDRWKQIFLKIKA